MNYCIGAVVRDNGRGRELRDGNTESNAKGREAFVRAEKEGGQGNERAPRRGSAREKTHNARSVNKDPWEQIPDPQSRSTWSRDRAAQPT